MKHELNKTTYMVFEDIVVYLPFQIVTLIQIVIEGAVITYD